MPLYRVAVVVWGELIYLDTYHGRHPSSRVKPSGLGSGSRWVSGYLDVLGGPEEVGVARPSPDQSWVLGKKLPSLYQNPTLYVSNLCLRSVSW